MSEVQVHKALVWDEVGEHWYENGVDHCALYPMNNDGSYNAGVAWNGITQISESPDGADANDLWADNIKYGSLRAAEDFQGTIEAYTFPKEFRACMGLGELGKGVYVGQQKRKGFGLAYRTMQGNDAPGDQEYYKLHLVYGATVSPSDTDYETVNDSPDAITFSWEFETVPVPVPGFKPTAHMEIDSREVDPETLTAIETALFGSSAADAKLLTPTELVAMLNK